MDEIETTTEEASEEETLEELDTEETEDTQPEPKVEKPRETPEAKKARLERELKQLNKKLGVQEPKETKNEPKSTGGLDENALDFLDLKGITDDDEISLIETVIAKTGQTVRQALKDDYVVKKLESIRAERAVKDATPSSTKRGGNATDSLERAIAKFEQTNELPEDFTLRSQVVNAMVERSNPNKPAWH